MNLREEDLAKVAKLISLQIEHVTCLECCKYYLAPESAPCGHSLCHTCWRVNRTCPYCSKAITRSTLKLNNAIQHLTRNVQELENAFNKRFNMKISEVLLDEDIENDPAKTVKDWLANSENQFSVPPQSSQRSSQQINEPQNPINVSASKIKTTKGLEKVVHAPIIPQDDWDKIEEMPDSEDVNRKGKENVIGPMDIEPFYIDEDNEYTASHPRRSSRKRELKPSNDKTNVTDKLSDNQNDLGEDIDKKSSIAKQNWNNVKRMRKEFSKLNKKNRNKLNVSIEMCKRTQTTTKTFNAVPQVLSPRYDIDENTPINNVLRNETSEEPNIITDNQKADSVLNAKVNKEKHNEQQIQTVSDNSKERQTTDQNDYEAEQNVIQGTNAETKSLSKKDDTITHNNTKNNVKMPFYKRSALNPKDVRVNDIKHINHVVNTNPSVNDDIQITIKVGNAIANIVIKKMKDMELKINTDREIQTSLGPHDINEKTNTPKSSQAQNIMINVCENNEIDVKQQEIPNPRVEELKKVIGSEKTASEKKNTDSADTATVQFEITESVEKELSKVMDFEDNEQPVKSKVTTYTSAPTQKSSKTDKSQKVPSKADEKEYINDLDIFDSKSIKEPQVQYLKNTEHACSEILLSTVKTKARTQKNIEKRFRGNNDDNILPKSKKAKYDDTDVIENEEHNEEKKDEPESESTNYDAIMGTVFANIDADIEEIHFSQNNIKNTYSIKTNKEKSQFKNIESSSQDKNTITDLEYYTIPEYYTDKKSSQFHMEGNNQKDSENIFSMCVEKEDGVDLAIASSNKKMPVDVPPTNINEYLTPVISQAANNDAGANDDSDKSVVEETPQKTTSFTKAKPKSNTANREVLSQRGTKEISEAKKHSIVNLTDTSMEIISENNITAIKTTSKKPTETPLTIDKFIGQIRHESTPCAKKSLNFGLENADDITLCATNDIVATTTQEREFMNKAFEKTPTATVKPQTLRNLALKHKKNIIAGSCLTNEENVNLQKLCIKKNWVYRKNYEKDITHLVVGVDDENKAKRSVKYMCALASSKWIISYLWVQKCLVSSDTVNEEEYEALDSTGYPGPMRSRLATNKLFHGITFFCMEPFGVLDVNTLKEMLVSAGGRVVEEAKLVRVTDNSSAPALLLAEPENTQEDRFIYLAMELSIVPVNHEWALNCLGSYSLTSIQDLLLCPASLLPKATEKWPQELLALEDDDDE